MRKSGDIYFLMLLALFLGIDTMLLGQEYRHCDRHHSVIEQQNDSVLFYKIGPNTDCLDFQNTNIQGNEYTDTHRNNTDTVYFIFNQGIAIVFLATSETTTYTSSEAVFLNDTTAYLLIEAGQYDVFGTKNYSLSKYFFFLEQEYLQNQDTVFFLDQQAENEVDYIATDIQGTPLRAYEGVKTKQMKIFFPEDRHTDIISFKVDEEKILLFSNVSGRFRLFPAFVQRDISINRVFHIIQYAPLGGINTNVLLDFSTADYLKQSFRMHFDPEAPLFRFGYLDGTKWKNASDEWEASFSGVITSVDDTPWEVDFFYTPDQALDTGTSFLFNLYNEDNYSYYQTKPFSILQDSLINDFDDSSPLAVRTVNNDLRDYGNGLVNCSIEFDNFISFNNYVVSKVGSPAIRGMFLEDRITELLQNQYFIRDTVGNILDFGSFGSFQQFSADVSKCVFEVIDDRYLINGNFGEAMLNTYINFENADRNPPLLTAAMILDWKGLPRAELRTNDAASMRFSIKDSPSPNNLSGILIDSCHAWISNHGEDAWIPLNIYHTGSTAESGEIFEADLTAYASTKATYDLKIVFYDSLLNKTEYFARPAFAVADFLIGEDEKPVSRKMPMVKVYPNPAENFLYIELDEAIQHASIELFSINGLQLKNIEAFINYERLELAGIKPGPYLLKISNKDFYILKTIIVK